VTRLALSAEAWIHTSRSLVALGLPWIPTAYAPTTRNLALATDNAESRSRKSSFTVLGLRQIEELFTELPNYTGSRIERDAAPEPVIRFVHAAQVGTAKHLRLPTSAGSASKLGGRHFCNLPHVATERQGFDNPQFVQRMDPHARRREGACMATWIPGNWECTPIDS